MKHTGTPECWLAGTLVRETHTKRGKKKPRRDKYLVVGGAAARKGQRGGGNSGFVFECNAHYRYWQVLVCEIEQRDKTKLVCV